MGHRLTSHAAYNLGGHGKPNHSMNYLRKLYVPILTQITVPFIILAALLAGGGAYLVTRVIFLTVEERFTNQLLETSQLANESIVREEDQLLEAVRLITHLQGMDAAIRERQPADAQSLVLPIAYNSSLDAVVVLYPTGAPVVALVFDETSETYVEIESTTSLRQQEFAINVLAGRSDEQGDKFAGFATIGTSQYFLVGGPVLDSSGKQVGAAFIGRSAEGLAQLIREETLGHVTFYNFEGQPLISTLLEGQPLDPAIAQEVLGYAHERRYKHDITDSGIEYSEMLSPLMARSAPAGLMGVALPANFLETPRQNTRTNTLALIAAGVSLVVVIGMLVARRITRPIQDLKNAALQVSQGNLQIRVPRRRADEIGVLTQSFNQMVASLDKSKRDLIEAYDKTIEGWSRALDLRDHETEGHSRRVAELSAKVAREMGIKGEELEHLRRGALLHDIGKIAVPDTILLKQGKLTDAEFGTMKQHPVRGKEFMEQIDYLKPAMDIPYSHHERWDGTGYPQGLSGEQIPLAARIFAPVDVLDALTSDRPYRKAMTMHAAMDYIKAQSGSHFDPAAVDALVKVMDKLARKHKTAE